MAECQFARPVEVGLICTERSMYKLCFYVPDSHLEAVKKAVFAAGAGRIGAYDSCCWQVLGQGQYRPLEGSQPFIGETRKGENGAEMKVELVVADEVMRDSVKTMKKAHPYEAPACDGWRMSNMQFWPNGAGQSWRLGRPGIDSWRYGGISI